MIHSQGDRKMDDVGGRVVKVSEEKKSAETDKKMEGRQ